jgi:hypothetical protein
MNEYRIIEARKRSFVINAEMPEKEYFDAPITYYLVNQDGDYLTNGTDRLVWGSTIPTQLRIFPARKRSFVINAEVNNG